MTRVFAHRGDATAAEENTVEAFLAAVAAGAHGVELDVRRSLDGALVVHHDAIVEGIGAIADLPARGLPASVALLDEVMDVCGPLAVNVEIKNDPSEPGYDASGSISHAVVALLEGRGEIERVIVSSFDLATLDAARQAHDTVATGWLLGYAADPLAAVDVALAHGADAVHPFVLAVTDEAVARAHAAGLEVNVWTVNARHDLERMVRLGADIVITDDVAAALEVVAGTGLAEMADRGSSPLE